LNWNIASHRLRIAAFRRFAKDTTPFSEFLWADFLRRRMSRKVVDKDFEKAMETVLALARSRDAIYLQVGAARTRTERVRY